jgi:hypothetical protein
MAARPLVLGLICACAILGCACGASLFGPPSAKEILARPARAALKDAHFSVSRDPSGSPASADIKGDGDIVFRPRVAMHLTETSSMESTPQTVEILAVNGSVYQRMGAVKWSQVSANVRPAAFSAWSGSSDPRYVGEEPLGAGRCWHVAASYEGNRLDLWVRESDGFPLRAKVGQLVVTYSNFNSGVRIEAPAPDTVRPQPRSLLIKVGEVAHLNGVDVAVPSADLNYQPASRSLKPKAGQRCITVEVAYTLTGNEKVTYGLVQWQLTDAHGTKYAPVRLDKEPRLGFGDLASPGDKAHGFLSFEAPSVATGLTLTGTIGSDTVTLGLG